MTFEGAPGGGVAGAVRRMRLHALVVLGLTFIAGLALGWGIAHRVAPGVRPLQAATPSDPARRGPPPDRRSMQERLGLTAAQCASIDSIFRSQRAQIDSFWRGPGSELRAILDSTRADVRAVLAPEQRVMLDSIEARRRRRGQEGAGGRGRRDQDFCGTHRGDDRGGAREGKGDGR